MIDKCSREVRANPSGKKAVSDANREVRIAMIDSAAPDSYVADVSPV